MTKNVSFETIYVSSIMITSSVASTRHLYLNFESRKETSEEVWVLLTRHVVDSSQTSEFISLKVEIEDELRGYSKAVDQATIAAKVREFTLRVIVILIRVCFRVRTRTVHMFLCVIFRASTVPVVIISQAKTRIPSSQASGVLSIFTSYDGDSTEIGFSLTVYANSNLAVAWNEEVGKPLFTNKVSKRCCSRQS
jgi:calpain-7